MVAAIKHGKILEAQMAVRSQQMDFSRNALYFSFFICRHQYTDHVALAVFTPQRFFEHVRVVGDQRVGGGQNVVGRPIVLFEFDHVERGVILLQQAHVLGFGAAP